MDALFDGWQSTIKVDRNHEAHFDNVDSIAFSTYKLQAVDTVLCLTGSHRYFWGWACEKDPILMYFTVHAVLKGGGASGRILAAVRGMGDFLPMFSSRIN